MKIGVCYYPEHWPEERWEQDARHMREIGISIVRVGEFAWQQLEPEDGNLQFDWLHRALDTLHANGHRVVLGTPTATPPKWLVDKHPDMLAVGPDGMQRRFGSRRHYCFSSEAYLRECQRIVSLLANEFGGHPSLTAWQTDNEYGCHNTVLSYSDNAVKAFRAWCSSNYENIDKLNQAWGNNFWSMNYRNFAEVDLPHLTVTEGNPSHLLAFWRFSSDQVKRFNKAQTDILRKTAPDIPVAHNFMGNFVEFDHRLVSEDLDIASWDSYPLGFLDRDAVDQNAKSVWMRTGHPDGAAFHHDLNRGFCHGRWWVMEQQPGPVNWAPHNPSPQPGMVRLWGLEAFAHGAETVSYFRWRQAPFAQEMMHTGILLSNGEEDLAANELRQLFSDISALAEYSAAPVDGTTTDAEVAIVFDYPSDAAIRLQRAGGDAGLHGQVGGRFDPLTWTQQAYSCLRRLGQSIDVIGQQDELDKYKLVIVACASIATEGFADRLSRADATIVIFPRSGSRTNDCTMPDELPPGVLQSLIPIRVCRSETLAAEHQQEVTVAGNTGNSLHLQSHDLRESIDTALTPHGYFEDGWGFHYQHQSVHYLNAWLEPKSLYDWLEPIAKDANLQIVTCPPGLRLRKLGDLVFAINYGPDAIDLTTLDGFSKQEVLAIQNNRLIGDSVLEPANAAVWALTKTALAKT